MSRTVSAAGGALDAVHLSRHPYASRLVTDAPLQRSSSGGGGPVADQDVQTNNNNVMTTTTTTTAISAAPHPSSAAIVGEQQANGTTHQNTRHHRVKGPSSVVIVVSPFQHFKRKRHRLMSLFLRTRRAATGAADAIGGPDGGGDLPPLRPLMEGYRPRRGRHGDTLAWRDPKATCYRVSGYVSAVIELQRVWRGILLRRRLLVVATALKARPGATMTTLPGGTGGGGGVVTPFELPSHRHATMMTAAYHRSPPGDPMNHARFALLIAAVQQRWKTVIVKTDFNRWSHMEQWASVLYYHAASTIQRFLSWVVWFQKKYRQGRKAGGTSLSSSALGGEQRHQQQQREVEVTALLLTTRSSSSAAAAGPPGATDSHGQPTGGAKRGGGGGGVPLHLRRAYPSQLDTQAATIQWAWRRFVQRQIFQYLKLILHRVDTSSNPPPNSSSGGGGGGSTRTAADRRHATAILKLVDPSQAYLNDGALDLSVKFRLASPAVVAEMMVMTGRVGGGYSSSSSSSSSGSGRSHAVARRQAPGGGGGEGADSWLSWVPQYQSMHEGAGGGGGEGGGLPPPPPPHPSGSSWLAFPPVVVFKVVTKKPVTDIGGFAPKDYTVERRQLPARVREQFPSTASTVRSLLLTSSPSASSSSARGGHSNNNNNNNVPAWQVAFASKLLLPPTQPSPVDEVIAVPKSNMMTTGTGGGGAGGGGGTHRWLDSGAPPKPPVPPNGTVSRRAFTSHRHQQAYQEARQRHKELFWYRRVENQPWTPVSHFVLNGTGGKRRLLGGSGAGGGGTTTILRSEGSMDSLLIKWASRSYTKSAPPPSSMTTTMTAQGTAMMFASTGRGFEMFSAAAAASAAVGGANDHHHHYHQQHVGVGGGMGASGSPTSTAMFTSSTGGARNPLIGTPALYVSNRAQQRTEQHRHELSIKREWLVKMYARQKYLELSRSLGTNNKNNTVDGGSGYEEEEQPQQGEGGMGTTAAAEAVALPTEQEIRELARKWFQQLPDSEIEEECAKLTQQQQASEGTAQVEAYSYDAYKSAWAQSTIQGRR